MNDENAVELYRKYRPTTLGEVVGQKAAIAALSEMGRAGKIPHCLLFTGPSGTGKTTLARILRTKLKCSDADFHEINGSSARGVDTVREIESRLGLAPMGGDCRVYLIDECHALTTDAQNALLKILEDTPKHVYFFLATTDPQKLKKTIITRATAVTCAAVSEADLIALVRRVATAEGFDLADDVAKKIAATADGSARRALVSLHQVARIKDREAQLAAVVGTTDSPQVFEVCRLLLDGAPWSAVAKVLAGTETEDPEGVRRMILAYMSKVVLGGGPKAKRAASVLDEFRDPLYDLGRPGLVLFCWNAAGR